MPHDIFHFPFPFLLLLLLLLTTLSLLPSPSLSSTPHATCSAADVDRWCAATPHPGLCRHYSTQFPPFQNSSSGFYRTILQLTLGLADRAQAHVRSLGWRCQSDAERTAWLDCWRLYADTALQLNRTSRSACSRLDAQTWLSAALTNLDTCRKGFAELGAPIALIDPVVRYNLSDLISNLLAVNNAAAAAAAKTAPSWMMMLANKRHLRRLLQLGSSQANLVVAQDGSGNFRTIKDALNAAAQSDDRRSGRLVIYVKAGVYSESLQVVSSLSNLTLVGDGIGRTIITAGRSVANGFTTFSSPTFSVFGDGFIATGITFRNTFGPGSQAVALLSASDRSVFYRCSIEGYQDTLCVFSQRQFYRECDVYGTIDFIFGNAAVVFQNCNIFVRRPRTGESNVVTAQGRSDPNQNTGIVVQSSAIRAAAELVPVERTVRSYLGRPWMQYSRTIFVQNYIDSIIDPAGWLPFNGNFALDTLYYAEFRNTGPGSRLSGRVRWPGYHLIGRASMIKQFSVGRFIAGGTWIPSTGVPFSSGI